MPPFRNPFNRRPAALSGLGGPVTDENARPVAPGAAVKPTSAEERPGCGSSRGSSALSIPRASKEPDEFKMSVVNDSGVYLPPSPPEKRGFWGRTPSTATSSHRSVLSDNEPFSISRESFDSYRRSFDISARSPVAHPDSGNPSTRQSLDSYSPRRPHHHHPPPRSAFHARAPDITPTSPAPTPLKSDPADEFRPRVVDAEVFEDVGLADGTATPAEGPAAAAKPPPKKRGLFARFGEGGSGGGGSAAPAPVEGGEERPGSSHRGFHLPGRKRGQSGQGAELRAMPRAGAEGEGVAVR